MCWIEEINFSLFHNLQMNVRLGTLVMTVLVRAELCHQAVTGLIQQHTYLVLMVQTEHKREGET